MWFQVELPQPARLTEIQFDGRPGPGGGVAAAGRGRGAVLRPHRRAAGRSAQPPRRRASTAWRPASRGPDRCRRATRHRQVPQPAAAYPRGYKVEVSMDGNAWSARRRRARGHQGQSRSSRSRRSRRSSSASPRRRPWKPHRTGRYRGCGSTRSATSGRSRMLISARQSMNDRDGFQGRRMGITGAHQKHDGTTARRIGSSIW